MRSSGIGTSNLSEFIDSVAIISPREINEIEILDISFSLIVCGSGSRPPPPPPPPLRTAFRGIHFSLIICEIGRRNV